MSYIVNKENEIYYECGSSSDNALFLKLGDYKYVITDGRYITEAKEEANAEVVESRNLVKKAKELMELLNGEIIFIKGNHDKFGEKFKIIEYNGYKFMLIHNPDSSYTFNFDGWVIHGHHHANHLDEYPFINPIKKRVNVSVEVIDYKPVSLDLIIKLIERGETIRTIKDL